MMLSENTGLWQTDGRTDRQDRSIYRASIASHGKNSSEIVIIQFCLWWFVHSAEAAEKLDNILFTTLTTLRPGDCYVSMILHCESYMQRICAAWYTLWPGVNTFFILSTFLFEKNVVNIAFIYVPGILKIPWRSTFKRQQGNNVIFVSRLASTS